MKFWVTLTTATVLALFAMPNISQAAAIKKVIPPPPPPMHRSEFFDTRNLGAKVQRINQWIMEGRGGFKESGDFRFREGHYFWKAPLNNGSHRAMIHELTRTMVRMEKNQNFRQGNHRTAVICLLDYLAANNIEYVKDPIHLYLDLAQSSHPDLSEKKDLPDFINRLADKVQAGSRKAPIWGVTNAKRLKYTERIKFAGRWHHVKRVNQIEEENGLRRIIEAQTMFGMNSTQAGIAIQSLKTLKKDAVENEKLWSPKAGDEW